MDEAEATGVLQNGDDSSFQPERTGLAWSRTLVGLAVAFGILGVHAYRDGLHIGLMITCAAVAAVLVAASSPVAHIRARRATDLMVDRSKALSRTPLLLLAAITAALALASFFLILLRG